MSTLFDRKFGAEFIKSVPLSPGVYEVYDRTGQIIYIGKAKLLRRRLQQYRNARRCKKHHKMRAILKDAAAIKLNPCDTDLDALLLENQLIQQLKPRFNVAGAFSFLYPMIGIRRHGLNVYLVYTTSPKNFPMFDFYGAYRSRDFTREGYFALLEILGYIGHREPKRKLEAFPKVKFSHVAGFRQVSDHWIPLLDSFLRGEAKDFLETSVIRLLEKPLARRQATEVQEMINELIRFFKFEARPLRRAMAALGLDARAIEQENRDRIFLSSKYAAGRSS